LNSIVERTTDTPDVTVAVPVRNAGARLRRVLQAVRDQETALEVELLVCDSGSTDASAAIATAHGARLLRIAPSAFSHGATRNLLAREARGRRVVFLTQDSVPASTRWLERLVGALARAPDVGLAFGPYLPVPEATASTARELEVYFASFGVGRTDRLTDAERELPPRHLLGPRGFFTNANGAVNRSAWERVPFRDVPYAEDHQLAIDMMRAGYAKAYAADAAVEHSHEYSAVRRVRRSFDEWRALREIYGWVEPLGRRTVRDRVLAPARNDVRWARERGATGPAQAALATRAVVHHGARTAGAALGSRHRSLPPGVCRRLSLESRATFPAIDDENVGAHETP
jgi:rhamnosyltransferase